MTMQLFNNVKEYIPGESWICVPKGMENRVPLFMANMDKIHRGKSIDTEFLKRKISLIHHSPFYFDELKRLKVNPVSLREYIHKNHFQLESQYYFHAKATGILQGIYWLWAEEPYQIYIGSVCKEGRSFTDRWKEHKRALQDGTHHCKRLQSAFNRTGKLHPVIFWASNTGLLPNAEITARIHSDEETLINKLWYNCYNERRW